MSAMPGTGAVHVRVRRRPVLGEVMISKLRPQIMFAIVALSVLCGLSIVVQMKEIAIASVTGIILLAREVITQDNE